MRIWQASEYQYTRAAEYGSEEQHAVVKQVLQEVREHKDAAVKAWTKKFDGVVIDSLRVQPEEIEAAYKIVGAAFIRIIQEAAARIRAFHEKQKRNSWMDLEANGTMLGQQVRPLRRVGVYVPGGKAAYPSSVLMNVIPAQVAGVPEIVMVTPPASEGKEGIHPYVLVAAAESGVKEIYKVGGAQAIAALAYGTESILAVDKICGPGNIYVALAKRYVYGLVDIDSIAGPTDIVVLADDSADAQYVAADLLSQAEHDEMASAKLITMSSELAEQVKLEVERQLGSLPRERIARESIERNGAILMVSTLQEGIDLVNNIAPEHLELLVREPISVLASIENAGAIFMGPYSSEPVGDYFAGPNHVLPTNGTSRFSSPLSVDDFMKKSSVIYYSKKALMEQADSIMKFARFEGFEAHARAIQVRLEKEGESNGS